MNALTISLKIQGSCHIIGQQFDLWINEENFPLLYQQKNFEINKQINCAKGWNTLSISHPEHPNDLTLLEQNKVVDYSYVSLDHIILDGCEISRDWYIRSGSKAYNPSTDKSLYLYDLGETFQVDFKFYNPIEHWTFALASGNGNWGKIGWKNG